MTAAVKQVQVKLPKDAASPQQMPVRIYLTLPCHAGETRSEGGFAANKVSVASLLDVQTAKDKKGKS